MCCDSHLKLILDLGGDDMDILCLLNDYTDVRDCVYKGEYYSVRDNGAVLRHSREGKRKRKDDGVWTFGRANEQTGYMAIGSERVHRIVAYAFLGEPPTPQHVVDHIDTNRRNNRPQNLRWLTKLENVLNNPITRKKIEYLCGSIEAFVNDPSMIQEFANNNPNFEWMRTVTQEEAKASYERLCTWAKSSPRSNNGSNGTIGEWIYSPPFESHYRESNTFLCNDTNSNFSMDLLNETEYESDNLTESLTENAMQRNWKTPTEFPLCPSKRDDGVEPLVMYFSMIKKGEVITKNRFSIHFVDDFALCDKLFIRTHADEGLKRFSLVTVTYENGTFIHEGKCFWEEQSAEKAFTLAQGLEWDGEEGIDDLMN